MTFLLAQLDSTSTLFALVLACFLSILLTGDWDLLTLRNFYKFG